MKNDPVGKLQNKQIILYIQKPLIILFRKSVPFNLLLKMVIHEGIK